MAVSRRAMSRYIAEQLVSQDDSSAVVQQLAAYLVQHRQTKQLQRYIDDIERELAERGVVVADVFTARTITEEIRDAVEAVIGREAQSEAKITLREHIQPELVGGILIRSGGKEYDRTIKSAIRELRGA